MELTYLNPKDIRAFIKSALKEDLGSGDHSSIGAISRDATSQARLLIKDHGIIAGLEMSRYIFEAVSTDLNVDFLLKDGDPVEIGQVGLSVSGNTRNILAAERLVLNCTQRMSGIATYTNFLNQLIKGTKAKLLDTRKTTPNFRLAEKWAVAIGGGVNHRFGLYDMVILKDNHVDYAGGVKEAILQTINYLEENDLPLKIELEVRSLDELREAIKTGRIHRVMLDNMLPSDIRQAIRMIGGQFETEASGGITEKNIQEIAETGIDFISVGALTHSYKSLDMSLKAF
ncbi:MAG: carboxylating nicotinate-nucleotide diphosphorylase [Cytophagales bacterium]|nr:carboxylating nicotinate-nucleotide diphosphorylase [Cytophagales bacterium]